MESKQEKIYNHVIKEENNKLRLYSMLSMILCIMATKDFIEALNGNSSNKVVSIIFSVCGYLLGVVSEVISYIQYDKAKEFYRENLLEENNDETISNNSR